MSLNVNLILIPKKKHSQQYNDFSMIFKVIIKLMDKNDFFNIIKPK